MSGIRGRGAVAALAALAVRTGVLRRPVAVTRVLFRLGGTLPAAIELGALRTRDGIALVRDERAVTYSALRDAVRAATARLARRFRPGARVGIDCDGGIETVVLLAAAVAAGLDAVPLGTRLAETDRARLRAGLDAVLDPCDADLGGIVGGPTPSRGAAPVRRHGRILFLSTGTTGAPRATARGRLSPRGIIPIADLDRRIRWPRGPLLVLPPLDHGHGFSATVAGLVRGETVLLASARDPDAVMALISAYPPASVTGVPVQLRRVAQAGAFDVAGIRRVVSGSATLTAETARLVAARTGASVIDCLGTTETGTFAVRDPVSDDGFAPLAGVTLTVVDAAGSPMARGEPGRLRVRGALAAGTVSTGDAAVRERDGIRLRGRTDGLADSGGELVSAARLQVALLSLPGVVSCRVAEHEDAMLGTVLAARVVVATGTTDPEAMRTAVRAIVGPAGAPRRLEVVQQAG